ncbi:hypothetical protein SDRG_12454 [Saprolegnia diclina VS20]|uniref:Uncharacterized protein n=1 Tax=Saprolegnia diclina (strain VS20) TaxID=1156394 RepID=T0Q8X0_SAPDV|nr:hypothetical protein SDRG_12454 [Saprolegnia diclina VS20]EQC29910.1 hypothetical protein SDRG_12454 [Saprolegnia diclina VS20]|eukprot:XP_008616749.1 hypothetical protein SDRG_12454 [Saprolegnia diclina VS20]
MSTTESPDARDRVNPTLVIKSYDSYEAGVQIALHKDTELMKKVATMEEFLKCISAHQYKEALKLVNTMLKSAVAASHGFACNTDIVRTLGDYQTLVVDTDIAADAFLRGCMQVLKSYKLAFVFLLKGNLVKTKKMLLSTCEVAGRMEAIAGKLAEKAEKAMKGAQASLEETKRVTSKENKKKEDKELALELTKNLEARAKCCEADVAAAKLAVENAEKERRKQGFVDTTDTTSSSFWGFFYTVVSRQGARDMRKHVEAIENEARASCRKALEKQHEVNQAIIDIVRMLADDQPYGRAFAALELTVKALGTIKTTFENVREFWSKLKTRYGEIAADSNRDYIDEVADPDTIAECYDLMTSSWHEWLALTKISYDTIQGMKDVKTEAHAIMSDLPNSAEASERHQDLVEDLEKALKDYDALIKEQIKQQQQ